MSDHCTDCGLCCQKLIIDIEHVDVVREPRLLPVVYLLDTGVEKDSEWENEYRLAFGAKRPCKLLGDDKRCTIYPTRPNCCVEFEVGGEHCNELRESRGLPLIEKEQT